MATVHKVGWAAEDFDDKFPAKGEVTLSVSSVGSEDKEVDTVEPKVHVYLDIHHIDVGQGECTLIALMGRQGTGDAECLLSIVIDGGLGREGGGTLLRLLHALKIDVIDVVAISHFDRDHFEGLTRLLVDWYTPTSDDVVDGTELDKAVQLVLIRDEQENIKDTKQVRDFFTALDAFTGTQEYVEKGDEVRLDCATHIFGREDFFSMKCVSVNAGSGGDSDDDENAHSIAWLLRFGKYTYYSAGDLPSEHKKVPLEDALADTLALELGGPLTAVKCGHHGSETSTSAHFLKTLKPAIAFISAGRQDGFGHPHVNTLLNLYGEPSVGATFLTSCMYNRPLVNDGYEARALKKLTKRTETNLRMVTSLHGTVPALVDGERTASGMDKSKPGQVDALRKALDDVRVHVQAGKDDLAALPGDEARFSTLATSLRAAATGFSVWTKGHGSAQIALRNGLKMADGRTLQVDLMPDKLTKDRATLLRDAAVLAEELLASHNALKTARDPKPFFMVAGGKTVLGNVVLRFDSEDADKDDRVAFIGLARDAWVWGWSSFGANPEHVDLPTDSYWDLLQVKKLKDYHPPQSPHTWDGGMDDREEHREERNKFLGTPQVFPPPPTKKRVADTELVHTDERDVVVPLVTKKSKVTEEELDVEHTYRSDAPWLEGSTSSARLVLDEHELGIPEDFVELDEETFPITGSVMEGMFAEEEGMIVEEKTPTLELPPRTDSFSGSDLGRLFKSED